LAIWRQVSGANRSRWTEQVFVSSPPIRFFGPPLSDGPIAWGALNHTASFKSLDRIRVDLFVNCQCSLVQGLGGSIAGLFVVKRGQFVQQHREVGMVWTECFLPDREGSLEKRLGVGVAALS